MDDLVLRVEILVALGSEVRQTRLTSGRDMTYTIQKPWFTRVQIYNSFLDKKNFFLDNRVHQSTQTLHFYRWGGARTV